MFNYKNESLYFIAWIIAAVATAGSLFFSEIMQFAPCTMCWYQRIAMYPLVILLLVGSTKEIQSTYRFCMPLVAIGWIIALYHNLLHFGIIPETATPCRLGISCATVYIQLLGFITIPMMSLFAFSGIGGILLFLKRKK
ncbi:MAG: disulfide bond formation protein B [Bdellovibrionales bacterium]